MAVADQRHSINLIPGLFAPVIVHCSFGDKGRTISLDVYNGSEPVDMTGAAVTVHGVRADSGNWGPLNCSASGHTVAFNLTTAMTSAEGGGLAEISVSKGSAFVGSANFAIMVERATWADGVTYSNDVSVYENILAYVKTFPAQMAAGDAILQANIDREKTERITAVNTEKSERIAAVNAEASARVIADTGLQAQIDQIVAPSGEAPSAAEVQNARIGADNVTYPTLGEAIRTQNASLKSRLEYQEDNGFIRKNYFDVYGNINTKRDGTIETATTLVNTRNGTKLIVNANGARSYGAGQLISGVSGSVRFSFDVESTGNGSSIVSRIYDISNYESPITTITASDTGTYSCDIVLDAGKRYAFVWYVASGTAPCGGVVSNIEIYDPSILSNVELLKTCKAPSLSDSMKTAIRTLINDYYDHRAMFSYYSTSTRNSYVTADTCFGGSGRAVFNCSTFVQMILMGRAVSDFANAETYSNIINKTFNNGFYFNFPMRTQAYQLAERENDEITGYYGFRHQGGDTYEGSFSYNTHYSKGSTNLYKQVFNSFMYACDMANELYQLGCEINFSELEVGDLVFFYDIDNSDGSFADTAFRNIIHVAMVENIYVRDGNKVVYFAESTGTYGGYPQAIIKWSLFSPTEKDRAKASYYLAHIAMCARNPIAFNFSGHEVPTAIVEI